VIILLGGRDQGKAGLTRAAVARIERDEAEPRMTTLRKLAAALEVDAAELVKGD
jgi:transcriptional regulator with XRE-family HTH domain